MTSHFLKKLLYAWTLTRKILVKVLAEFSITTTKPQIEWKHQMLRFIEKKNQLNLSDRRILADVHTMKFDFKNSELQ